MPGPRPNPTASRRALAARLRRMRLAAGRSSEDAARELMVSASKISRLESGERAPQPRDVRDLARYYGADDEEIEHLQALVSEARRRGWWEDFYSNDDEQSEDYLGLETVAKRIDLFENLRWPGLLQTPEATRAVLRRLRPPGEFSDRFVEDQVSLRAKRQERLFGGELALHVIIDEAMFHRPMGDSVLEDQVRRIIEQAQEIPKLTVQVVPFGVGIYPGVDGSFCILQDFEKSDLEKTVFVEGLLGNTLIERAVVVEHYQVVFDSIAADFALSVEDSLRWFQDFLGPG